MSVHSYSIGVDIGTGGCKTTIVRDDGAVVSSASREYPTMSPRMLWSEQDPNDWYGSLLKTVREAIEYGRVERGDIVSICVNGQPHTLVLLDETYEVLRPAIIWTDQRSTEQSEWLRGFSDDLFLRVGYNQVNPTWTISMLLWIRKREPQTWSRISKIVLPKDFIRLKLTGKWATDWTDAGGTLLADIERKQWSEEICGAIGLPMNLLPEIVSPLEVAGKVMREASRATGIPEGIEVITGACDPAAEIFGTGLFKAGQMAVKLATAGVVFETTDVPHPHPGILTYPHVLPGKWFSLAGTNSCSSSVRWFRDIFCGEEMKVSQELGKSPYELMDEEAGKAERGSGGLMYHPYLLGERSPYWDPYLRGSFNGIRMSHQRKHFIRSIFEGVSFSLKDCLNLLTSAAGEQQVGKDERKALLLGGGSKSSVWSQILSDVLGIALWKLESVDASFGSALMGGVGVRMFESPQEAVDRCLRISEKIRPDPRAHSFYAQRFFQYKRIHDALADIYREL